MTAEEAIFLRNRWYVAALSTEVTDTPLARTLLNTPMVLYRDTGDRDHDTLFLGRHLPVGVH